MLRLVNQDVALLRSQLGRRHNVLVRRSDRVEATLKIALAVLAVILVPIALFVGIRTDQSQSAIADEQASRVSAAVATTLENATPPDAAATGSEYIQRAVGTAPASWNWMGSERTGEVSVDADTPAGTQVDIWLDSQGLPTSPPLSHTAVQTAAVVTGVFTWFSTMSLATCAFLLVQVWLNRRRTAEWERQLDAFLGEAPAH
ncbi:hypothetical protein [Rhodococcus sp. HNM0569]|uniref:Rv1733c family protein n=1 Tax=Rhodococcus sp. HNM0569 TaxID=2716340 RepID=UPI00146D9331|nr:hypothetical protein [Rhodococcus sp. HNM0569]NLU85067.1 hypothetical protein [Rhodococcus sp. HNM0569]